MAPNTDDYNHDELIPPEWLNVEFFTKVLHGSEQDSNIEVKEFQLSPATVKGDHYASVMFRASVEYQQKGENKTKSLIIKTMPEEEGTKKDMLGESYIFETEIGMYTEVLRRFERILRELGEDTILAAPCLYHSLSPKKLMVFEDIVPQGYTVLRDREVNLEEAKCALLKLAKWHAVSYKLIKEDPSYFDQYSHGLMNMPNIREVDAMTGGLKVFIETLHTVPELKQYIPYFEAMDANLFDNCITSNTEYRINPQADAFYVLCHGDFHLKNMMFNNDPQTGKLKDVMLLDFQLCYVGPIVNDLLYSIYMLLSVELRANHLDELLYYYFTNFVETLKKISYEGPMPKMTEFRKELVRHKHLEIFLLVTFLPMVYATHKKTLDPNEVMDSADARKALYQCSEYIDELKVILPKYLYAGYLEN